MAKKYSLKFWIIFWTVSVVLLVAFYFILQIKNSGSKPVMNYLPVEQKYKAVSLFADYFLVKDDQERIFLLLLQNNMEIRPGGGFIGAFGILKIKNGKITEFQIHDTSNFDGRIPDTLSPPYPMKETLRINSWKLRDSNWSPDFPVNAKKAEEFYYLGQGQEQFDGIIGITANVLTSFLKVIGPIQIEGYPGTYDSEKAIINLEYQVEKAFEEQGIARGERKSVMNDLTREILKRVFAMSNVQRLKLLGIINEDLNRKDIQLYFKDEKLEKAAIEAGWGGLIDKNWKHDYLMLIDANLGAWKSDYHVKRSLDYAVDLSGEKPKAVLKITYNHTAKQKDFMTNDYLTYARVYTPNRSWLTGRKNFDDVKFVEDLGKKYYGATVKVLLGESKTVELEYDLPPEIVENYNLKIQKQAGVNDVPVSVSIIQKNGQKKNYTYIMNSDIILDK